MKKIYIAGCGGMLGEAFHQQFKETYELKCTDKDINVPWLSSLDFRNHDAYLRDVVDFRPDYLFHLGAYTDLEFCERNRDDTYITNTLAAENAVLIANKLDIPILFIGTAGIFDGSKEHYDDWDIPNPLGVYARTKYLGERYVVEHAHRYLVCRAGWMMGAGPTKDKKFIQKIMRQLKDGHTDLCVVSDKGGTPTYTHDFARNVKLLIEQELWGLYNMACGGQATRLDVAQELISLLNLTDSVRVHAVDSSHFSKDYFAPRPASEQIINRKLELRGINTMRDWRVALKDYLATYYEGYLA